CNEIAAVGFCTVGSDERYGLVARFLFLFGVGQRGGMKKSKTGKARGILVDHRERNVSSEGMSDHYHFANAQRIRLSEQHTCDIVDAERTVGKRALTKDRKSTRLNSSHVKS